MIVEVRPADLDVLLASTMSQVGAMGQVADFFNGTVGRYDEMPTDRWVHWHSNIEKPFGWSEYLRHIYPHTNKEERLRFVRDGKTSVNLPDPNLAPFYLRHMVDDGNTVVVDEVQTLYPKVRELCDDLSEWSSTVVSANCYASFAPTRGFALHTDGHDVMAIQLEGSKRWRVANPDGALDEIVLHPGDVLFVPAGVQHDAVANGKPSLHLTIGFNNEASFIKNLLFSYGGMRNLSRFTNPLKSVECPDAYGRAIATPLMKLLENPATNYLRLFRARWRRHRIMPSVPTPLRWDIGNPRIRLLRHCAPPTVQLPDGRILLCFNDLHFEMPGALWQGLVDAGSRGQPLSWFIEQVGEENDDLACRLETFELVEVLL